MAILKSVNLLNVVSSTTYWLSVFYFRCGVFFFFICGRFARLSIFDGGTYVVPSTTWGQWSDLFQNKTDHKQNSCCVAKGSSAITLCIIDIHLGICPKMDIVTLEKSVFLFLWL